MGELKPCPFCGGSALLRGFAVDEAMHWWVACENCGATSGELLAESTPDRDFAVESWNHRTHPQPVTPAETADGRMSCPVCGDVGDAEKISRWTDEFLAERKPVAPVGGEVALLDLLWAQFYDNKSGALGDPKDTWRKLRAAAANPPVADAALAKWAQGLIEQLPADHDGRNSWLLNHGVGEESDWLRAEHARYKQAWADHREGYPQPTRRRYQDAALNQRGGG